MADLKVAMSVGMRAEQMGPMKAAATAVERAAVTGASMVATMAV